MVLWVSLGAGRVIAAGRGATGLCLLVGYLAIPQLAQAQLLSPGDLSRAHGKLEGDGRCTDCHSRGRRVDTVMCTKCHTDIRAQRSKKRGLHGRKFRKQSCGHCHVEHRGISHQLIRWAGGSPKKFEHGTTGFKLTGAHRGTGCRKCHTKKNRRGAATYLGLSDTCASCHEDPHERRFGDKCQSCHNVSDFKQVRLKGFDHSRARFALRGAHTKVECAGCHQDPPRYRELEFSSCANCHEDPHEGRFKSSCANCHDEKSFKRLVMKRKAHPGLSLRGGHRKVGCNRCHDRGRSAPPKAGSRCVSCHEPVHEAAFGDNCRRCHKRIEWLGMPDKDSRAVHRETPFALAGKHTKVACTSCHDPKKPVDVRYRKLEFEQCKDCHDDAHGGEFAANNGGECGPCHSEHGFAPTRFGVLAHAETSFPLDGGHAAVPCGSCHGKKHPRLDLRVANARCADCHDNPHGDQFAAQLQGEGCAHCHNATAWNRPSVDHATWPLTGAHATAACASCHRASDADQKAGKGASYRGVARRCEACHQDEHLGQFRLTQPKRACDECHRTERFTIDAFDHGRLAGLALQGRHVGVECAKCHPSAELANGLRTTRYRLGYRACADCHADPHAGTAR